MFCKQCGSQIDESAKYCPQCGACQSEPVQNMQPPRAISDTTNAVGYGFLGFFFPIVGLVLFLVWRWERPKAAKASGLGALISTLIGVVSVLVVFGFYCWLFFILALSLGAW